MDVYKLLKQHRERLDQIEGYYRSGGLTAEQVINLLEGKQASTKEKQHEKRGVRFGSAQGQANRVR